MISLEKIQALVKTPEGAFAALASIFGLLFLFAIPPLQTPDEPVHFVRAYQISQGGLIAQHNGQKSGGYLPTSINKTFIEIESSKPIKFHPELKFDLRKVKAATTIPLNQEIKEFYDITNAATYSPIGYLPQSAAIFLGRLFNAPPIYLIYMARLAVLASWIVIIFYSIRIMPYKKWAIALIALIPMVVAQSVSMGVDAISISAGVLFISLILRSTVTKKSSRYTVLAILLSAATMVLSKQISILLLPLIFLIDNKKLSVFNKPILAKFAIAITPILLLAAWTIMSGNPGQGGDAENNQNTTGQIHHLLENPLHFSAVLFNTFFFGWGDSVVESVIGIFGWADTPLSEIFFALGYMLLAIILFVNYEEQKVTIKKSVRWVFGILSVVYSIAVCGAMYILYSPVGFNIVVGVQGRYLLPILFLTIPVTYGFASTTIRKYLTLTIILTSTLLTASTASIIFRYLIDYRY